MFRLVDVELFIERVRRRDSLAGADLRDADPFIVDLTVMDLREADLSRVTLPYETGEKRWSSGLTDPVRMARRHVRLRGADLTGARLDRILGGDGDFREARLVRASLVEADLQYADFTLADLTGADFTGADLERARLLATVYDGTTRWPDGFEPPN